MKIPKKITPCPILEAIVEIRFTSEFLADAIFGVIYNEVKSEYPKFEKLPILQLPDTVRLSDPNLKYQPFYRLANDTFILQIGPSVISLSCPKEYVGWDVYFKKIIDTYDLLQKLNILSRIERLGVRYINFFDFNIFDFEKSKINLKILMNESPLKARNTMIRAEIEDGIFINMLQVLNNAMVTVKGNILNGSVIDIDTFLDKLPEDFFGKKEMLLSEAHDAEKRLFFGLLSLEYIKMLNPIY